WRTGAADAAGAFPDSRRFGNELSTSARRRRHFAADAYRSRLRPHSVGERQLGEYLVSGCAGGKIKGRGESVNREKAKTFSISHFSFLIGHRTKSSLAHRLDFSVRCLERALVPGRGRRTSPLSKRPRCKSAF